MQRVFALISVVGLPACTATEPLETSDGDTAGWTCEEGYQVGDCSPDFALPEASGEEVSLSDYSGSVVLLASEALW